MALHQHLHGIVDYAQHGLRSCPHLIAVARSHDCGNLLPKPPRRGEVQVDRLVGVDTMFGCASTESPNRCQLPFLRPPPGDGGVSEDDQVFTEQLDRGVRVSGCRLAHRRQPIIQLGNLL